MSAAISAKADGQASGGAAPAPSPITEATIKSMAMARVFKMKTTINSMDFFRDGTLLVTSTNDGTMSLYDTVSGLKYGIGMVRFTHHQECVLHTSHNGIEDSIRYLSLYDCRYLRFFTGHTDRVVSLAMCPNNDTFASTALDHTLRFWDLRTSKCQALLRYTAYQQAHHVQFDPDGLVLAASFPNNVIKLFDYRNLNHGPFTEVTIDDKVIYDITGIKFSPTGEHVLVSTLQGVVIQLDGINLKPQRTYAAHKNENIALEATFSADGKFILSGAEDGSIRVWSVESGEEVTVFENVHSGPVRCLQFSPGSVLLASSCTNLVLWLPDRSKLMDVSDSEPTRVDTQ